VKILIIGSKGFIGSHCVSFFSKEHEVWQCDVVVDYTSPNYLLLDASNADYNDVFQNQQFDICINCSGAASVPDSIKNPQRDFILNTHNVFKQLDAIRKYNANCKYINLSSAAVYGNPVELPVTENQELAPISPYGMHKKMAEEICKEFYNLYAIETCSLRVFSAYGNGLKKQLFWDLYQKYKSNKSIVLYGTGNESRDFININDLVVAINCVMLQDEFEGGVINVANGKELAIKTVVTLFFKQIDPEINFSFEGQKRVGDPINWVANIDKLSMKGYKQKVGIEEGISNYVKWLKENE